MSLYRVPATLRTHIYNIVRGSAPMGSEDRPNLTNRQRFCGLRHSSARSYVQCEQGRQEIFSYLPILAVEHVQDLCPDGWKGPAEKTCRLTNQPAACLNLMEMDLVFMSRVSRRQMERR